MKSIPKNLILIIAFLTLYRLFLLFTADTTLYADEAQYWTWAQQLDWGYYSKPPMIAWVIAATTSLFGDGFVAVKLGSLLFYPLTTFMLYLLAKRLFDENIAFWSAVAFITMPAVSMSSLIISTDVVLIFFWASALYSLHRALEGRKTLWWLLLGVSAGLGLLSKYSFAIFVVSAVFVTLLTKEYRTIWKEKGVYIALSLAVLIFLPNLIWNANNHFVSFMHTKEISQVERDLFHPDRFIEFVSSQFAVFGPVFFGIFLYLIGTLKQWWSNISYRYLFLTSFPFVAFISFQSLISRAMMNWAAPTYAAATLLVVAWLIAHQKMRLLKVGIGINIALALLFYHYHDITHTLNVNPSSKQDPYKRVMGWDKLGAEVKKVLGAHPEAFLLSPDRKELVTFIYYTQAKEYAIWNPTKRLQNHYDLTTTMNNKIGRNAVLVIAGREKPTIVTHFEEVIETKHIIVPLYKDFSLDYTIYYLKNFKGYAP